MKKKILLFALMVAALSALLCLSVFALEDDWGDCGENVSYTFDAETATLTISGEGDMTAWSSASYVPWYSYCDSIENVIIENGVTYIGTRAFNCCFSLASIDIPESVTSIGYYAFSSCSSLTSIEIPKNVTLIGNYAFSGCSSLTSIDIPDGVTTIGSCVFYGCSSLTSIEIPNGVQYIYSDAFSNCTSLKTVTLPIGLTSIGIGAFANCTSLETITFPGTEKWWNNISKGNNWVANAGKNSPNKKYTLVCENKKVEVASGECEYNLKWSLDSYGTLTISGEGPLLGYYTSTGLDYTFGLTTVTVLIPNTITRILDNNILEGLINLETIYFGGTYDEWNAINKASFWDRNIGTNTPAGTYQMVYSEAVYTVTFKDYDGSVISTKVYREGETVEIPESPTREADAAAKYSFYGWDSEVETTCNANATYTAVYKPEYIKYRVVFVDYDSRLLSMSTYNYGDKVTVPSNPTRKSDGTYVYIFSGWGKEVSDTCTGDAVYVAEYEAVKISSADRPVLVVESKTVILGDTLELKVSIKNNPGIMSMTLTPSHSSELKLVAVELGNLGGELTVGDNIVWLCDNDAAKDDVLLTLVFELPTRPTYDKYIVNLNVRGCVDHNESDIPIKVAAGGIEFVEYIYGDATDDGLIDNKDLVRIKKYLAAYDYDSGTSSVDAGEGADATGDGIVDNKDLVRLKKYLAAYDYDTGTSSVVLGPNNVVTPTDEELLVEILDGFGKDVFEIMTDTMSVDAESSEWLSGISELDYAAHVDAMAVSMPMMMAQAHHQILVKCRSNVSAMAIKDAIEDGFDPGRWVCVCADKIYCGVAGEYVYMVASRNEWADKLFAKFEAFMSNTPVQKFEFDTTPFIARG